MPVDQASYRRWTGSARPGRRAALAIASTMVRSVRRSRMVKSFIIGVPLLASAFCVLFFSLTYLIEANSPMEELLRRAGLAPEEVNYLAFANRLVDRTLGLPAILLAALVGAPLIAEDRRARALALYFSRPIRHVDYVFGKMLAVGFFLGLLLLLPPILMYVVDVGFNPRENAVLHQLPVLLRSLVPNLARLAVLGAVALGASALTRRTNHAVMLFLGVMIVSWVASQILARQVFEDARWLALSPGTCAERLSHAFLPLPRQLDRSSRLMREMDVGAAWLGIALWTAAGLGVLAAKVRRVEVVS